MPRLLVLYRHAKSDWSDPACPDRERPLNARGQRDAQRMATVLAPRLVGLAAIACSPSRRTRLTLEPLREQLPPVPVSFEEALYEASPDGLDHWLRTAAPPVAQLLILGHEYGLSQWTRRLCPDFRAEKIPTAACLALEFAADSWQAAEQGRLVWFVAPKVLFGGPPNS